MEYVKRRMNMRSGNACYSARIGARGDPGQGLESGRVMLAHPAGIIAQSPGGGRGL
jgi:hypothetical protein